MARQLLPLQEASPSGAVLTFATPTVDGLAWHNSGKEKLIIKNVGASPITVTFVTPGTVEGGAIPDKVVTVPASGEYVAGNFPRGWYNQPPESVDAGKTFINFNTPADARVALLKG